jgi:hypothetical protein
MLMTHLRDAFTDERLTSVLNNGAVMTTGKEG